MQILLPGELEQLVRNKIESGRFDTAEDVVREALLLLDHLEGSAIAPDDITRRQIETGWLAAQRGDVVGGDEVFDRIDRELSEMERQHPK